MMWCGTVYKLCNTLMISNHEISGGLTLVYLYTVSLFYNIFSLKRSYCWYCTKLLELIGGITIDHRLY